MLGVSLDDVWNAPSLLGPAQKPTRTSKYTKPMQQPGIGQMIQQRPQQANQGMVQPQRQPPLRETMANQGSQQYVVQPHQEFQRPQKRQMPSQHPAQMEFPVSTALQEGRPTRTQEIPFLKEYMTEQSHGLSKCEGQLHYLKSVINDLKVELSKKPKVIRPARDHTRDRDKKKKDSWTCAFAVVTLLLLLVIIILLLQMTQKLNRLLQSPLQLGAQNFASL
jgi:hypothetical protein